MNFDDVKSVIIVGGYLISIITVFLLMKNRQYNLEKELGQIRKILYGDRGNLNLVDVESCKNHRDQIFNAIRRGELVSEMLLKRIEELNKNVLIIMVHLNIRSPNSTALEDICKSDD